MGSYFGGTEPSTLFVCARVKARIVSSRRTPALPGTVHVYLCSLAKCPFVIYDFRRAEQLVFTVVKVFVQLIGIICCFTSEDARDKLVASSVAF